MKTVVSAALLALLLPAAAGAKAPEYQDLSALETRVAALLGAGGVVVPIDRRIKLARCPTEPEVSPSSNGAVAVRCPALGWRVAVLVSGGMSPRMPVEILVRRGDMIELVSRGPGYSVTSTGTALDEGAAGKTIRVRIPTSSAAVSAIVTRAGGASISN